MAERTGVCASSQEVQKPKLAEQRGQMEVGRTGNWMLVSQLRILREPRKLNTINEFVVSTATKPVISLMMEFSNSVSVVVFAASTRAQFPSEQVILVLGELLLERQYAAAEYWAKNSRFERIGADTADMC